MVKGRGERGKKGETILQSIYALILNQGKGITASKIGKTVEDLTNKKKDRDGVRKTFQHLFLNQDSKKSKDAGLVQQIVTIKKRERSTIV